MDLNLDKPNRVLTLVLNLLAAAPWCPAKAALLDRLTRSGIVTWHTTDDSNPDKPVYACKPLPGLEIVFTPGQDEDPVGLAIHIHNQIKARADTRTYKLADGENAIASFRPWLLTSNCLGLSRVPMRQLPEDLHDVCFATSGAAMSRMLDVSLTPEKEKRVRSFIG